MEGCQSTVDDSSRTERSSWNRRESATRLQQAENAARLESERWAAKRVGVPRSTLRNWSRRKAQIDLPASSVEFWESPEGVDLLHRILVAAHLVFCNVGPCGPRLISKFLQLTGLDRMIGASYGAQRNFGVELQHALVEFGDQEKSRLAEQMSPREITVCEDETFHPQICLVAIEPLSDFLLMEKYASNRESETWTQQLKSVTEGIPIKIVQSTSDEGRSLIKHCRAGLGAHHSPDVFHVQRDASRAFSGKTNGAVQRAKTRLRVAKRETARLHSEREATGQSELFDKQIQLSQEEEMRIAGDVELAEEKRQEVRDGIRGISDDYHPFDIQTGEIRQAEDLKNVITQQFDNADRLADEWEVTQGGRKLLAKARKSIGKMVATVAFFWRMFEIRTGALKLSPATSQSLAATLLSGRYLEYVSQRASKAEDRKRIQQLSQTLLAKARDGPLRCLSDAQQEEVEAVIRDCAGIFQRSSSCVEGRNGRLALHHHGLHRLSGNKLAALTTLHNYFITRADRTTAAERFFGSPPRDLFLWLLQRLPLPPRPRHRAT